MDQIKTRDIGGLWAEHYPCWQKNGASKTLCLAIALMMEDKAQAVNRDEDLIETLHKLLNHFHIAKDQFYEIENEIGDV